MVYKQDNLLEGNRKLGNGDMLDNSFLSRTRHARSTVGSVRMGIIAR